MLARTFTATVSPVGGTGARRLITGDSIVHLSFEGDSFADSEKPDTREHIPGIP